ncbi:hypothetical protein ACFWQG_11065 [Rhodococcus sp. NPDC058532]|uniref:hypothetical protein n=1 Tax=Rhodococcus sp. NPDC058532 TaxID=3346540 RepID=UPI003649B5CA
MSGEMSVDVAAVETLAAALAVAAGRTAGGDPAAPIAAAAAALPGSDTAAVLVPLSVGLSGAVGDAAARLQEMAATARRSAAGYLAADDATAARLRGEL